MRSGRRRAQVTQDLVGCCKDLSFFYFLSEDRAIEETLLWLCVWELQGALAALHGGEWVCVG